MTQRVGEVEATMTPGSEFLPVDEKTLPTRSLPGRDNIRLRRHQRWHIGNTESGLWNTRYHRRSH